MKKKSSNHKKVIVKKKQVVNNNNNNNNNNNKNEQIKKKLNNKQEIEKKEIKEEKGEGYLYMGEIDKNGIKNGKGIIYYEDGTSIEGIWKNNELNGNGIFKNVDLIMKGEFIDGALSGEVIESDRETGKIIFKGEYKDGQREGRGVLYMIDDGGEITGTWKDGGQMSGWAEYTFPSCNGRFKIEGKWLNGNLIQGKYKVNFHPLKDETTGKRLEITPSEREYMTLLESYYVRELTKEIKDFKITYDLSDDKIISKFPLMPDIYEKFHCFVKESEIPNSGEGLFAKIDIPENTIISFYNGIRLTHEIVNERSWDFNSNTISLDIDTVIDVPSHYNNVITQYCSTISHKANHKVPGNNSIYSNFYHPRFGDIKCIKSIKSIKANEEILVDYGYSNDIPDWFRDNNKN